jgi:hypothetical protein
MRRSKKWTTLAGLVACLVLALTTSASAASKERYTAIILAGGGAAPTQVIMSIKGWTTDAEAKALKATLASGGPDAAQKALEKISQGYISFVSSLGWPINVARAYPAANGGQRIVLLTNRPIGFGEGLAQGATLDYPFGIVELQVDAKGQGTGSIIGMAKVTIDDQGVIKVDPYAGYATELMRVRREN